MEERMKSPMSFTIKVRSILAAIASLCVFSVAWANGYNADWVFHGNAPTASGQVVCSTGAASSSAGVGKWDTPANCGLSGGSTPTSLYVPNLFTWTNTGVTSPFLRGTVVKIGSTFYAFGGYQTSPLTNTNHIWTAPVSTPTTWTDQGALLPSGACSAWDGLRIAIIGTDIYAFGGEGGCSAILHSTTSSPLSWTNTGHTVDTARDNVPLVVADGELLLYSGSSLTSLGSASTASPTTWSTTAGVVGSARWLGTAAWAGNRIYVMGGSGGGSFQTSIIGTWTENPTALPLSWSVTGMNLDDCPEVIALDSALYMFGSTDTKLTRMGVGGAETLTQWFSVLPEANPFIRHARWIGSDGYMYMVQGSGTNAGRIYKSGRDEVLVWNYDSSKIQDYPAVYGTSSDKSGQATIYPIQVQRDGVPAWWTTRTDPF
jgi:hypothetical protein